MTRAHRRLAVVLFVAASLVEAPGRTTADDSPFAREVVAALTQSRADTLPCLAGIEMAAVVVTFGATGRLAALTAEPLADDLTVGDTVVQCLARHLAALRVAPSTTRARRVTVTLFPDGPPVANERPAEARDNRVSHVPPHPTHPLDVRFDGVELLGYDLRPDSAVVGHSVSITWYWHCSHPLPRGYRQLTHGIDARSGQPRMNWDDVGQIRELYPADRWRRGEYIIDDQLLDYGVLDAVETRMIVAVGFWRGADRLRVLTGDHDDGQRVSPVTITFNGAR